MQVNNLGVTQICVFCLVILVISLSSHFIALFEKVNGAHWDQPWETSATSNRVATRPFLIVLQGFVYICFSAGLIKYNKFLMNDKSFPFTINLTLGHSFTGCVFLYVARAVKPTLFTSLQDPEIRQHFTIGYICKNVGPVAACSSISLVLSNLAYKYCTVAFLQMLKGANVMLVYFLSLAWGSEIFNSVRARLLLCVLLATLMEVEGELGFDLAGVFIQIGSQMCECSKVVMQAALLCSASRQKPDPMSFSLFLQLATFFCILVILALTMTVAPFTKTALLADYAAWWPHLLLNACVALGLNTSIAFFVSSTSGIAAILLGIVKDVFVILVDVVYSGSAVSSLQKGAICLHCCFIFAYSMFKLYPEKPDGLEPTVSKKAQNAETSKANTND